MKAFTISLKLSSELNTNTFEFSIAFPYSLCLDQKSEKYNIISVFIFFNSELSFFFSYLYFF